MEGLINHYNGVRLRVKGTGNLKLKFLSLDEENEFELLDLAMISTTHIEPVTKANFNEQRVILEIKTTEINETFLISRVVIFVKSVAVNYPG